MNPLGQKINVVFGWGVYLCLMAGGLAFFGFLVALVIGGPTGEAQAIWLQKQYFPVVIRCTSFIIILGLVGMYVNKEKALSIATDKEDADKDITMSKRLQHQKEKELE